MTPFLICFIQKDLVPITTKVVSSNPVHGEAYPIQHYVIKFASDLRWFSTGTPVFSTNKTDCHDITQILLKVALNTINPFPKHKYAIYFLLLFFTNSTRLAICPWVKYWTISTIKAGTASSFSKGDSLLWN